MDTGEQQKEKIWDYYRRCMPYCDRTDVPWEILENYAGHACWLRQNVEWCRKLPEDIFLEYVAAYRINNEKIEDCRKWFCDRVLPLLRGMTLRQAILEVNLWCSAQVTYHPADERTVGPLTAYRSGFGRCGEESVFAVTVLRSVGIAARQVYAPLWSHCDDNHAWVEVYCSGSWHYLGACEPEPVLDRGWFDQASSRAMLIHGRSFCGFPSGERALSREGQAAFYSVTARYAATAEVTFVLRLPGGEALVRTPVNLEVLNYAHYGRIARLMTDERGRLTAELGFGSLRLSCAFGGRYFYKDVTVTAPGTVEAVLREPEREMWSGSFFRTPGGMEKRKRLGEASAEGTEAGFAGRIEEEEAAGETSVFGKRIEAAAAFSGWAEAAKEERQKRLAACFREEEAAAFPEAAGLLRQAGENFGELLAFLQKDADPLRTALLKVLTVKDLYDIRAEVLEEHLQYAMPYREAPGIPEEIFLSCLLNPRVEHEELSAYRGEILRIVGASAEALAKEPEKIWTRYCREVVEPCGDAYDTLCKLPVSVLKDLWGSGKDRNILFVAVARSVGVPARLNPQTKEPEYYRDGHFCPADPGKRERTKVTLCAGQGERYAFPGDFSFARWETDHFQVWDLSSAVWKEGALTLEARAGEYRIVTVRRLEDGSQLAREFYFALGKEVRVIDLEKPEERFGGRIAELPELILRRKKGPQRRDAARCAESGQEHEAAEGRCGQAERDAARGTESGQVEPGGNGGNRAFSGWYEISLRGLAGGRRAACLWIREGEEPTEHLLCELLERAKEAAGYEGRIFVFSEKPPLENGLLGRLLKEAAGIRFWELENFTDSRKAAQAMGLEEASYPLALVLDEQGRGIYGTCGYHVGAAAMLLERL